MSRGVRAYWWNEEPNFGDAMTPLLISRLFDIQVEWAALEHADLAACGSVLQWITRAAPARTSPIDVWGSGFLFEGEAPPPPPAVRYHAMRGRVSQRFAGADSRTVLGDPGLLAANMSGFSAAKKYRVGVVPHLWHVASPAIRHLIQRNSAHFIDVRRDPATVIEQIAACEYVFASSLHGLVVADSFGIPNWWIATDPQPFGGPFKFADYYSVFDLEAEPIAINDTLDLQHVISREEGRYVRPGLREIQRDLAAAFPF